MENLLKQGRIGDETFNPFEKKKKWFRQTKSYKTPEVLSQIFESEVMNSFFWHYTKLNWL